MQAHTVFVDQLPVKALTLLLRDVVACGSEPAYLNARKYTMASEGMSSSLSWCQPVQCNAKQQMAQNQHTWMSERTQWQAKA